MFGLDSKVIAQVVADVAELKAQQVLILAKLDQLLAEKKSDGPVLHEPGN